MLVARAENYLHGRPDLDDTIGRLQAFEKAGAEVLYAPGLTRPEDIRSVCVSVTKPVNVLVGLKGAPQLSVRQLGELGVRRISVGSGFSRAALTAFYHAAREIIEDGTFTFADETLYMSDLTAMFSK
jgi:2-methylisocitrate lyase-like PEP mutase family enzyme